MNAAINRSHSKSKARLFPLRWWLQAGCLAAIIAGITLWRPNAACPLVSSTETLAPGLTLRKFPMTTPQGDTQIYLIRGERASGWRFDLALSQGNVMQRETVTNIAQRKAAIAAVNGGFFAYQGAALGAVKTNGEWSRLPWKNRTAIGITSDGKSRITNLRGEAKVKIGDNWLYVSGLNGYPAKDGITILTSHFGTVYNVKPNETALEISDGKITRVANSGGVNIRADGFVAVANGAAQTLIAAATPGQSAEWKIETTPADWSDCPTILGAGPRLVADGKAAETSRAEEFRPDVLQRGPRTGVGIDNDGNPLFVIADGRRDCSPGLTLPELATLMASLGAKDALHMDCGPSSVLAINGKVANRPLENQPSGLSEPTVPNAVLITRD